MPYSSYVYQIEDILAEINKKTGRRLELHAFWKYPIWEEKSLGFKIHEKFVAPHRVFHLSVPVAAFREDHGKKRLDGEAVSKIIQQIESYFEIGTRAETGNSMQTPLRVKARG